MRPRTALPVMLVLVALAAGACAGGAASADPSADGGVGGSTTADGAPAVQTSEGGVRDDAGNGGASDGGDGAATAGYDPHVLTGLALWLESTKGVIEPLGGAISWADQSGNGNDATLAAGTEPPDRNTAGSVPGGLGFHGYTTLEIADHPSLRWGTGDFLVEVVASNNYNSVGSAAIGTFWSYQDGSYKRYRYGEVFSKIVTGFGPGPVIVVNDWTDRSHKLLGSIGEQDVVRTPADSAVHLVGLRRKGAVLELRKDGVVVATRSEASVGTADVSAPGAKVAIGGRPDLTHWVGGIWEIVAVKGSVADADLATFEVYAKTKYGL